MWLEFLITTCIAIISCLRGKGSISGEAKARVRRMGWELLQEDLEVRRPKGISHGETREVKTLIVEFCTRNEQIDGFCFPYHIPSFPWERGNIICIAWSDFGRQLCKTNTFPHFYLGSPCFPQNSCWGCAHGCHAPSEEDKSAHSLLKGKKKANNIFTFTLAASSRRESRCAKRCKHVLSNRYLLLCQQ